MARDAAAVGRGQTKGLVLRQVVRWYEAKEGRPALERVLARVPAPYSSFLQKDREALGLLAGTWYPSPLFHALLEAMVVMGYERGMLARDASEAIMKATMTGLYQSLFRRLGTPGLYARYANTVWLMYHDSGVCELEIVEEGRVESRVTNWAGHHPVVCEMNTHAGGYIFNAMACHNVRVRRTACVTHGDPLCAATITWSGQRNTPPTHR